MNKIHPDEFWKTSSNNYESGEKGTGSLRTLIVLLKNTNIFIE